MLGGDQTDDAEFSASSMREAQIAPVPRVSIQAFCETPQTAAVLQGALEDRRMNKAHVKIHMGGAAAAVEAYRNAPTPNVIVIEGSDDRRQLLENLDSLAQYCDSGTKVVALGRTNDIMLYRELMARGVSEYLVEPFDVLQFVRTISELYTAPGAEPLGRIIAVCGSKGGVGASTVAHNLAWSISSDMDVATVIVDLDLPYGTAGLDFNQDPPQGIAEAVYAPDRLDANLIDRLLSKCTEKLSLLAAPATLERSYDFDEGGFDSILDVLRATVPVIILDVPHMWTAWTRRLLVGADEVVIVATPDLGNLRNTKNIVDALTLVRPNDEKPRIVMNMIGVPKRPEIGLQDFNKAIGLETCATIAFDPKLFGTAGNNGQMIAEVESGSKTSEIFSDLARVVTGRSDAKRARRGLIESLLPRNLKFNLGKAS